MLKLVLLHFSVIFFATVIFLTTGSRSQGLCLFSRLVFVDLSFVHFYSLLGVHITAENRGTARLLKKLVPKFGDLLVDHLEFTLEIVLVICNHCPEGVL